MQRCNSEYVASFYRQLRLEHAAPTTVKKHEQSLRMLIAEYGGKDFKTIRREELEGFVLAHGGKEHLVKTLKKFYRLLGLQDRTANIKLHAQPRRILPGELLGDGDVRLMVGAAQTKRDKAIIRLMWDTGIRPEELLTMRYRSLDLTTSPAHITVAGKTGQRTIPIHDETARVLIDYLDSSARLAVGSLWAREEHSNSTGPLGWCGLRKMLGTMGTKAHIGKRIYPYLFRHSAATRDAANGYTETQLDMKYGWALGSKMPATYLHLNPSMLDSIIEDEVAENKDGIAELTKEVRELKAMVRTLVPLRKMRNDICKRQIRYTPQ